MDLTPGESKMADSESVLERSFTKKRKEPDEEDTGSSQELTSSAKRTKNETKKRRSSFAPGRTSRRSLPASNVSCAELHTKVPYDEAAEKRLYLLKQACFEYAMQRLKEESPGLEGFEDFEKSAHESFQLSLDKLNTDGILQQACKRKNSSIPNPINIEIEKTATQIQVQMDRLHAESKKWNELLEQAQEDHRNESQVSTNPPLITHMPASLSKQQMKLIKDLPDLSSVQTWAKDSVTRLKLQIDKIHQSSQQLKQFESHSQAYMKDQIKHLATASFAGSVENAKQMISGNNLC